MRGPARAANQVAPDRPGPWPSEETFPPVSAPEGDFPVTAASGAARPPWEVLAPERQTAALVFASPHSGSDYPADFLAASRLDAKMNREPSGENIGKPSNVSL